ncbi:hypothetical protein MTO96_022232 [Rhipicephalus appendiculatus]
MSPTFQVYEADIPGTLYRSVHAVRQTPQRVLNRSTLRHLSVEGEEFRSCPPLLDGELPSQAEHRLKVIGQPGFFENVGFSLGCCGLDRRIPAKLFEMELPQRLSGLVKQLKERPKPAAV